MCIDDKISDLNYYVLQKRQEPNRIEETRHKCRHCGREFGRSIELRKHKSNAHLDERPLLKCVKCLKSYRQLSHLKIHKLVHIGEKLYKCKRCVVGFKRASDLIKHQRVHGRVGKSNMDKKNKSIKNSRSLIDRVNEEKPFKCKVCKKNFA